ncbi:MAG: hypothetical protein A3J62_02205 [Candidatus Buchananbacteria bacterium RIFCSPHIGHO2_02_FULL_38_8]|uniref:Prepilin-type N-terminal cleavage/methylation domain-containing protein n=1 Tax=Candidatus Buchananbacteria bacterium RIFCSPHIGHO2_02_FULL_38_8 TaxID=1797538 RepID=A0A1G1Y5U0_9BACT|nr:hypothetical protein [uncultured bacterium]OGY47110.1 MAG: hypothetical protein A3J62_02205 [Candidatus Buchananbacteria bacterium RIFCSPHIGHO2_02_FULL_38_8]
MKSRISNLESRNLGFTPHHFYGSNLNFIKKKFKSGVGFTLIEMIIYLAIVAMVLTAISYLILDIISGQTTSFTDQEVNYNLRFISNNLIKDIKSAQDISSLSGETLVLTMPGEDITYNFNSVDNKLTRQLGSAEPINIHSDQVEVNGSFSSLSYLSRAKNVGIHLEINYKNPDNLSDYNASTTVDFAVELRGRR